MSEVRRTLSDPPLPPDDMDDPADVVPATDVDRAAVITSLVAAHARLIDARRALLSFCFDRASDAPTAACADAIVAVSDRIAKLSNDWNGGKL